MTAASLESLLRSLGGTYLGAALLANGVAVTLRVRGTDGECAHMTGEGDTLETALADLVRKMERAA